MSARRDRSPTRSELKLLAALAAPVLLGVLVSGTLAQHGLRERETASPISRAAVNARWSESRLPSNVVRLMTRCPSISCRLRVLNFQDFFRRKKLLKAWPRRRTWIRCRAPFSTR